MDSIGIHVRSNYYTNFGGDVKAIESAKMGIESNGVKVKLSSDLDQLVDCEFVFLTNSCLPIVNEFKFLQNKGIPIGVITFYEDFSKYHIPSLGFYKYIHMCLDSNVRQPTSLHEFNIKNIKKNKDIIYNFLPEGNIPSVMFNKEVFMNSRVCITSSYYEKKSLLRDHPNSNVEVVKLAPGIADEWSYNNDNNYIFTEKYNLEPLNYFLQVGRLETRKNQLCTLLSASEFSIPLVFIANKGYCMQYPEVLVKSALKYCNNRIIIISDWLKTQKIKNVEIYNTQEEFKGMLPADYLKSAYINCLANVHPAFYELPGYTYIESSIAGRPSVASNWTAIKDYIDNELMYFCEPHDIEANILRINNIIDNKKDYPIITNTHFNTVREMGRQYLEILDKNL